MKCPNCGQTTLLADLMKILNGETSGDNTNDFVEKFMQEDFPQFPLLKKTLNVMISHNRLVDMKFDMESTCERFSTILKYLADFLEIATKRQGSGGMSTIFQNFNPMTLLKTSGSPEASDSLNEILDGREHDLRQAEAQARAEPPIENDGDGEEEPEDDPFNFNI
jgi:hypothetical protein